MSSKGTTKSIATRQKISKTMTKYTKVYLRSKAREYIDHLNEHPEELPTLSGFCMFSGLHKGNLTEKRIEDPELNELLSQIETAQEHYCLVNGITNAVSPGFAQFILKTKHDYKDQPTHLTQNNTMNISPDLLADALKLMSSKD